MLKAIWAARWYLLLGFFVFTITLIVTAPLHFIWRYAEPHAARLPVKIQRVSGTLWDGKAQLNSPRIGQIDLDWQLNALQLLMAKADLTLKASGQGFEVTAKGLLNSDQRLQLNDAEGFLSSDLLKPMLRRGKASLQGEFELSDLNAVLDLQNQQILDLNGRLVFSGGDVGFPVDGKPVQAELPLLVGQFKREESKSVLDIATQEGLPIGQAFVQNDGWGGVAIRRRFLDILGQKWPAEATEETVIFEVSQKIL